MTKSEAQTRSELVDCQLVQAGWNVKDPTQVVAEFDILVDLPLGIMEPRTRYEGHQFSDYVLLGKDGKPLAVIEAKKKECEIPISLDTYKSAVAKAGIQAGADLINDIWGLKYDAKLAEVIASSKLPCCLMHNRGEAHYRSFLQDVIEDLAQTIQIATKAGIEDNRIILDPGIGFGKSYENNLEMINNLEELHMFGYPLLLGTSKKSVMEIGRAHV